MCAAIIWGRAILAHLVRDAVMMMTDAVGIATDTEIATETEEEMKTEIMTMRDATDSSEARFLRVNAVKPTVSGFKS